MSQEPATTRWTVIPRGLDGDSLSFAVAVTPVPVDRGNDVNGKPIPAPLSTDVPPWNNWLTNFDSLGNQQATLYVQVGQPNQAVTIPVNNFKLATFPYDLKPLWSQMLAYSNKQWAGTEPADSDGTSSHLEDASQAAMATTPTQALQKQMDRIHGASIIAARARRGTQDQSGLAATVQVQLKDRLGALSYLAKPADRGMGAQKTAAVTFRDWLAKQLQSTVRKDVLNARAAERNLYRLSDNPYNTLDEQVFEIVVTLAGGQWPGAQKARSDAEFQLYTDRTNLIKHSIFHRRYQAKPFGNNWPGLQKQLDCTQSAATIDDFYRTLNVLSRYPELLPPLGLAFTFKLDISAAGLNNQSFSVAFQPPQGPVDAQGQPTNPLSSESKPPYTICTPAGFPASSKDYTLNGLAIANGKLVLDHCEVVTRDIDGEALRATQNAHVVRKQSIPIPPSVPLPPFDANQPDPPATINPDESYTIPTRTVGATLVHEYAAAHTQYQLRQALNLRDIQTKAQLPQAAGPAVGLELADLVRGYTVEVYPAGEADCEHLDESKWSSLTSRSVSYTLPIATGFTPPLNFPQTHFPIEPAASTTKDSVTPPPTGKTSGLNDLHQHSALFRWAGWGLTVDTPFPQAQPVAIEIPCTPLPIATVYAPPTDRAKRWLRLRYGKEKYKFRLSPMDLLCVCMENVSTYTDAKSVPKTCIDFSYLRSDPVHGPTLLLQLNQPKVFVPTTLEDCFPKALPGESMGCIVLRDDEFQPHSSRVLVPPVASFDQLVPHGVLDDGDDFKDLEEIGSFDDVAIEEDGNFPVVADPPFIKNKNGVVYSTHCYPYKGATNVVPLYLKPSVTPPSRTYLPDPMAEHLAVEMIDLSDPDATLIGGFDLGDFYPTNPDGTERQWPNAVRVAVQMEQERKTGEVTAVWLPDTHTGITTLQVGVPEGWQVRLRLKCVPQLDNAKEIFELPQAVSKISGDVAKWLDPSQKELTAQHETELQSQLGTADDLAAELALGHLDQVTPATEILLIHAVQKPLRTCAIDHPNDASGVTAQQFYDSPKTLLTLTASIGDRRSTGKVELIAAWTDIVDSPSKEHDKKFERNIHVQQWPLSLQALGAADSNKQTFTNVAQTFPDTNYRVIHLSVNSISRFENLYQRGKPGDDAPFTLPGNPKDTVQVTLQNTARLDTPRLNRIIPLRPAFWDELGNGLSRYTVYGAAHRIYIERPFQGLEVEKGGQGEQLGITLWGENFPAPMQTCYESAACFAPAAYQSYEGDKSLEPYVTRWGADPGLATGPLQSLAPLSSQFMYPRTTNGGPTPANIAKCAFPAELPLASDTNPKSCDPTQLPYFTIAYYPVNYDKAQQLWYADVQLSMAPAGFIRFALTRYQPESLINRECSRVTVAPLTPIPPHRELYFRKEGHHHTTLQICGTSQATNATGVGRQFEVELQYHRLDFFPSHSDRWEPASEQPQPASIAPIYRDAQYPVLATYPLHTELSGFQLFSHAFRVVVREYETLFVDTPGNRGLRTTERRLVDTLIARVP